MNSLNPNGYVKKMGIIDCRDCAYCSGVYLTQNKQQQISNRLSIRFLFLPVLHIYIDTFTYTYACNSNSMKKQLYFIAS